MGQGAGWRIRHIAGRIRQGAVVAYPTEGVWGLGCMPSSLTAVTRILTLKGRHWSKGLILVAASADQFRPWLKDLPACMMRELDEVWPGPVTCLVPDNGNSPLWIRGEHSTIALRVSDHPVVRELCETVGSPLVSTSANISGRPAARTALQIRKQFPRGIDVVVPGETGSHGGATEIRDLTRGTILRRGPP